MNQPIADKETLMTHFGERLIRKIVDPVLTALSDETLDVLRHVGLPDFDDFIWFETDDKLVATVIHGRTYLRIGYSAGRPLCIKAADGTVVLNRDKEDFVNTSVLQFLRCLYTCDLFHEEVVTRKYGFIRENRLAYAQLLQQRLHNIDPAIDTQGYFWPAVVESIEFGLFY